MPSLSRKYELLTDIVEVKFTTACYLLPIEPLEHLSYGFRGCIWIVAGVHGENLDDDIVLPSDTGNAVGEGAAAI